MGRSVGALTAWYFRQRLLAANLEDVHMKSSLFTTEPLEMRISSCLVDTWVTRSVSEILCEVIWPSVGHV